MNRRVVNVERVVYELTPDEIRTALVLYVQSQGGVCTPETQAVIVASTGMLLVKQLVAARVETEH